MAFGFLKKKPKEEMDIPPPPPPGGAVKKEHIPSELPPIRGAEEFPKELPGMPKAPEKIPAIPKPPVEKEAPKPKPAPAVHKKIAKPMMHAGPIEKEEEPKKRLPESDEPVFVNVSDYQTILDESDNIKTNIGVASEIVNKLNDLKNAEERELEKWRMHLEHVEKKLSYVDELIFKGVK